MVRVVYAAGRPRYSPVKGPAQLQLPYHPPRFRGNAAGNTRSLWPDMGAKAGNYQDERESA
jgi:hypothetical protein